MGTDLNSPEYAMKSNIRMLELHSEDGEDHDRIVGDAYQGDQASSVPYGLGTSQGTPSTVIYRPSRGRTTQADSLHVYNQAIPGAAKAQDGT